MRLRTGFVARHAPTSAFLALGACALAALGHGTAAAGEPIPKLAPVAPGTVTGGPRPRIAPPADCTAEDKVQVDRFWLQPGSDADGRPPAGRVVTVLALVRNTCNVALGGIPWRVTRTVPFPGDVPAFTETILSGTLENVAAGATVGVQGTWTAQGGSQNFTFDADPDGTLHETLRLNNRASVADYVVTVIPNWASWGPAAKIAAQKGVSRWLGDVEVRGDVTGPVLTFAKGTTLRPKGRPFDVQPLMAAGAPAEVAVAFATTAAEAWAAWNAGYQGPMNLAAFPTFALVPMADAPPTLATPPSVVLSAGSSGNDAAMSAANVGRLLRAKLGPAMSQPGADAAVTDFATWWSTQFTAWKGNATLANLMGSGHVPSFAPPAVPVGPVQHGTVTGKLVGGSF
jgi:hypothetical protein